MWKVPGTINLVSQAEHGYDSPVLIYTDSRELAEKVLETMPKIIADMPSPEEPESSWWDYVSRPLCLPGGGAAPG